MIKQVAVTNAAVRVIQPGPACKTFVIQNNGVVNVRLSFDGNTDTKKTPPGGTAVTPAGANAPTATTGYRLAAGSQFIATLAQYPNIMQRSVWGFSEGASVTLDVITDDTDST